jgi:hypothetical protein
MIAPRSSVRIALCGAVVALAGFGTAPAESLANTQFILAPTMDLAHHLA